MLVGREVERARLQALLDAARAGRSGALLLRGPAGIGKTALIRWAVEQADGLRVVRARGMESESDIPFAGLAELAGPLLEHLDGIPAVQADALRGALALGPAAPGDRFTVPAALLSLLGRAAEDRPLLVVVDDVQWLDEASLEAFQFAGRRLGQEGVAILAGDARRPGAGVAGVAGARAAAGARGPGAARRGDRPGRGRPARSRPRRATRWRCWRSPACCPPGSSPAASRWRTRCAPARAWSGRSPPRSRRCRRGTRRALLVAAAADTRRLDRVERGLDAAGLSLSDLEPAEAARIVVLGEGEVEFRHPLLRSTVYHLAPAAERRGAHAALAAAAAPDSAERAWHRSACAVAPDEAVAAALERAALDARTRGAHATAARDLGRAAQLTPEPEPRARRLLEAAGDAVRCGAVERARACSTRRPA